MVSDTVREKRAAARRLQAFARYMRRAPTEAEARFWHHARNRGIGGLKFRRQVPVGAYIADFLAPRRG